MLGETKKCTTVGGRTVCITTRDCDPLDPACVPTTISSKARMNMRGALQGFSMITPSWSPMPAAPTMPQLEGPWSVARKLGGVFSMITPSWAPMPAAPTMPQLQGPWSVARGLEPPIPDKFRMFAVLASAAVSAFHGTRRNGGSIFWGTVWFGLGALFPVITPVIALAQGLGDCANNCRIERTVHH